MIKAVKKLKLWPRKKRRKKSYQDHPFYRLPPPPPPARLPPPPPPQYHCCCSYSIPVQPSAPPLPPWLDTDQTHESIGVPEVQVGYESQVQEIIVETNPIYPTLQDETPTSYQQYTVSNPVYGVPVLQRARRERKGGFFGCVIQFGVNIIRCFCPCFRIAEVD